MYPDQMTLLVLVLLWCHEQWLEIHVDAATRYLDDIVITGDCVIRAPI